MAKIILFIFFILLASASIAQKQKKTAKPQVIVYGHEADAFSAAVQSAQSGVETYWIIDSTVIGGSIITGLPKHIATNHLLDVGSWANFLKGIANVKQISDSAMFAAKRAISPRIAQNVFEGVADTVKRLTLKKNITILNIEQSGKGWQVTLSNKEKIKVKAVVDASKQRTLKHLIKNDGGKSPGQQAVVDTNRQLMASLDYSNLRYRTGVVVGQVKNNIFNIPLTYLLPDSALSTLFTTRPDSNLFRLYESTDALPLLMLQGQASGAAAAYCAFFNTSANKINVRTLQGELLAFNGYLIPFQDITLQDVHHGQIQRVGAAGIFQGNYNNKDGQMQFLFNPDSLVSTAEIAPILKQLYTRSQIWFKDKEISALTLKDLLSLLKYVANRGDELNAEIEKGWIKRFKFKGTYNLETKLSRRQVAVLIDTYLQPFNVRVTLDGNFQY